MKLTKCIEGTNCNTFAIQSALIICMTSFYLRFCVISVETLALNVNLSSNLPLLLVSLYANSFYALFPLSIPYNEGNLDCIYIRPINLEEKVGLDEACKPQKKNDFGKLQGNGKSSIQFFSLSNDIKKLFVTQINFCHSRNFTPFHISSR